MTTTVSTLKNGIMRSTTVITAAATTAAGDIGTIRGKILKISVVNGTGSCGWWIFSDASDNTSTEGDVFDENILGATGAGHVDTAGATYYPVVAQVLNTAVVTDPDTTCLIMVDGKIEYNIDDCAAAEVLTIVIWYQPL